MATLETPTELAQAIVTECLEQLDGAEVPHPLPYSLVFHSRAKKRQLGEMGAHRYINGAAAPATVILGAKGDFSFRRYSRLTPATLVAYELYAREFASSAREEWGPNSASFRFDSDLPRRLYPEKKLSDRHRWKKFNDDKNQHLKRCLHGTADAQLYCMTADLARFFDLIRHDRLSEELSRWYPTKKDRISTFGYFLGDITNDNTSLPIGPQGSFFFADVLLLHADRAACQGVGKVIRWVDELWWFDEHRSKIESRFRETLLAYSQLGLVFNEKKVGYVCPNKVLHENEAFKRIRDLYYKKLPDTSAAKIAFLCGLLMQRIEQETPYSHSDQFIINRMKELYLQDPADAVRASELTLEAFRRSYKRSPDALHTWHAVLKSLPDRRSVSKVATDCFKNHRYPLDSDRARLLELITNYDSMNGCEDIVKTASLAKTARDERKCVSYRGNALRAHACRTLSEELCLDLARASRDRELRQYVAATALCLPRGKSQSIFSILRDTPLDDEDSHLMDAYYERLPEIEDDPMKTPEKFLIPGNVSVIEMELKRSIRDAY